MGIFQALKDKKHKKLIEMTGNKYTAIVYSNTTINPVLKDWCILSFPTVEQIYEFIIKNYNGSLDDTKIEKGFNEILNFLLFYTLISYGDSFTGAIKTYSKYMTLENVGEIFGFKETYNRFGDFQNLYDKNNGRKLSEESELLLSFCINEGGLSVVDLSKNLHKDFLLFFMATLMTYDNFLKVRYPFLKRT